jgi:hypothetical protein
MCITQHRWRIDLLEFLTIRLPGWSRTTDDIDFLLTFPPARLFTPHLLNIVASCYSIPLTSYAVSINALQTRHGHCLHGMKIQYMECTVAWSNMVIALISSSIWKEANSSWQLYRLLTAIKYCPTTERANIQRTAQLSVHIIVIIKLMNYNWEAMLNLNSIQT